VKVYIDGAYGTAGLALGDYLSKMDVDLIEIPEIMKKDQYVRKRAMSIADVVVLCLPDEYVPGAICMVEDVNPRARIIDASCANRCRRGWVYGMLTITDRSLIVSSRRIANPGCLATACLLGIQPLSHLFSMHQLINFFGTVGRSARGSTESINDPYLCNFVEPHKHLPEISYHGDIRPTLSVIVGDYLNGLNVRFAVPMRSDAILELYDFAYAKFPNIEVSTDNSISITSCNSTNNAKIMVGPTMLDSCTPTTCVSVTLDNLGLGSAGNIANIIEMIRSDIQ
jgi:N-acetyl-gamma-glutamyl-phosphate reductase